MPGLWRMYELGVEGHSYGGGRRRAVFSASVAPRNHGHTHFSKIISASVALHNHGRTHFSKIISASVALFALWSSTTNSSTLSYPKFTIPTYTTQLAYCSS